MANNVAIKYTLVYRIWLILSGGILVLCAPIWFTPLEQGFYFTFISLVGAHVLFELGAGFVLTQYVAHERASINRNNSLIDDFLRENIRLRSIYRYARLWFGLTALLFTLIIGVGGAIFFNCNADSASINWLAPWMLLIFASAYNLSIQPHLIVMEGLGKVGIVAKIRTLQSIIGNLVMWTCLFCGLGLYAVFIIPLTSGIITHLYSRSDKELQVLGSKCGAPTAIFKEVFPMQSKIALSWASGYFVFQAITPIIFNTIGPIEAGQLGLGLAALNGIQSVGTTWVNVMGPQFANYIARNKYNALHVTFFRAFRTSAVLTFSGIGLVWAGIFFIDSHVPALAIRFPSLGAMIPLGINSALNAVIFSLALYMRAHKQEPLLVSSVVCATLSVSAVYIASGYGFSEVCWAYALVTLLIGLPWTYVVFRKFNH